MKPLKNIPQHVHIVALWVALILTMAVSLVGFAQVISLSNSNRHALYVACLDTNERHRNTIAFLNRLAAKEIKAGQNAAKVHHALALWYILIQRELPLRDCKAFVRGRSS